MSVKTFLFIAMDLVESYLCVHMCVCGCVCVCVCLKYQILL